MEDIWYHVFQLLNVESMWNIAVSNKTMLSIFLRVIRSKLYTDLKLYLDHVDLIISGPLIDFMNQRNETMENSELCLFWNIWQNEKRHFTNAFEKMRMMLHCVQFFDASKISCQMLFSQKHLKSRKQWLCEFFAACKTMFNDEDVMTFWFSSYDNLQKIFFFLTKEEFEARKKAILDLIPFMIQHTSYKIDKHQMGTILCHLFCGNAQSIRECEKITVFWFSVCPPRSTCWLDPVAPFLVLRKQSAIYNRFALHLNFLREKDERRRNIPLEASSIMDAFVFYLDEKSWKNFDHSAVHAFIDKTQHHWEEHNLHAILYFISSKMDAGNIDKETLIEKYQKFQLKGNF